MYSILLTFNSYPAFQVDHNGKCITVFSAPNYCDTMCNRGAYITITGDDFTPKFTSFKEVVSFKLVYMYSLCVAYVHLIRS